MTTKLSITRHGHLDGTSHDGPLSACHLHDLGITISAGDLNPEQIAAARAYLEREVQALVERMNFDRHDDLGGTKVGWYVSYDGARECGEH